MPDFSIEKQKIEAGYKYICGIDEAGRGPLAGPVCAAAVILPANIEIAGLNDSKKLTDKKRRELFLLVSFLKGQVESLFVVYANKTRRNIHLLHLGVNRL